MTKMKVNVSERKGKIAIFIIALFGALILWIYAIGYDTQESSVKFNTIPVEITGVSSSGYTVAGISEFAVNVDVEVVGTRSVLSGVTASDFRAYVDISSVNEPGYATLPVKVVIPNGLKIATQSVQNVSLYIDKFTSKTISIQIEKTFLSEYSIGEIRSDLYAISLYGPESELQNAEAYCSFELGTISQGEVHVSGNIMLRDSQTKAKINNPYITMENNTVDVTFVMFREKTVPIELNMVGGSFLSSDVQFSLSQPTAILYGPVDAVSGISSLKLDFDESVKDSGKKYTLTLEELFEANGLPTSVSVRDPDTSVTYTVSLPKVEYKEITLPASSISIIGAPDNVTVSVDSSESIKIKVFGEPDAIRKYTAKSMTATIAYSSILQNVMGYYYGPLIIQTGDPNIGVVGIGYTALVTVQ